MKKILLIFFNMVIISILLSCTRLVTGSEISDNALASFNTIVKSHRSNIEFHDNTKHWEFVLENSDSFMWTKDTSFSKKDFSMLINAKVFIQAGLDIEKLQSLSDGFYVVRKESMQHGKLSHQAFIYTVNISDRKEIAQGYYDAMRRVIKQNNSIVMYDNLNEYYMLNLSNAFEVLWAKNSQATIQFIFKINAQPLIDCGLNVEKLIGSGWISNGNQLIREYDLEGGKNI